MVGGVTVDGALEALERARQEAGGQTGNEAAEAARKAAAAAGVAAFIICACEMDFLGCG